MKTPVNLLTFGFTNSRISFFTKCVIFFAFIVFGTSLKTTAQTNPTVGVILNDSLTAEGYTLLMPFSNRTTYLIDNCGLIVHKWQSTMPALIVYLLPNGKLLRGGPNVEILNWDGTKYWEYKDFSSTFQRHHDLEYLPNGNILIGAWDIKDANYLKSLGRDSTKMLPTAKLWDEVILEIEPSGSSGGQIVWQWRASEHTIQDFDPTKSNYGVVKDHPELLNINYPADENGTPDDWLHFNSFDYNPDLDQIMISCHTFDEVYIIDHSTTSSQSSGHIGGSSNMGGDLMYRWGNPQAYNRGNESNQKLDGQHDAQWILEGTHKGKVLLFNNKIGQANSTVEIIEPSFGGMGYILDADSNYLPENPTAVYIPKADFHSDFMCSNQLFTPDRLITCESLTGRVLEYDIPNDKLLWEYILPVTNDSLVSQGTSPGRNWMFRATKFAPNYSGFAGKTLSPTIPIEKSPWNSPCFEVEEEDTTSDTTAGMYSLIDYHSRLTLYPNPANKQLSINAANPFSDIQIIDLNGRVVFARQFNTGNIQIDVADLDNGMYVIKAYTYDGSLITRRLIISH